MAKKVLILLGTKKGAFILEGDSDRRSFSLRGPYCETWPINHLVADPDTERVLIHDSDRKRQAAGVRRGLQHQRRYCADQHDLGRTPGAMAT